MIDSNLQLSDVLHQITQPTDRKLLQPLYCAKAADTRDNSETRDTFTYEEPVKYVIEKHPKMQAIMISQYFEVTDKSQAVLSSDNMEKVEINSSKITGAELNPGVKYSLISIY